MDKRIDWIDTVRGMGIVLVVYGHVMRGLWRAGLAVPTPLTTAMDQLIYGFHMPLFFLLSGLLLGGAVAHQGAGTFVVSKLRSLAWPYVVWSLIQGSIEVLAAPVANGDIGFTEVWQHLWLPRQQFWFLYVLFWANLGLYGLLHLGRAMGLSWMGSTWLAGVLVCLLIAVVPGGLMQSGLYDSAFMLVGFLWAQSRSLAAPPPPTSPWLLGVAAVLAGAAYLAVTDPTTGPTKGAILQPAALVYALVMCWLTVRLAQSAPALDHVFGLLGRASLYIYVAHVILASGGRILAQHLLGLDNAWAHLAMGLLLGLGGPLLLYAARGHSAVAWLFTPPWPTYRRPVLKAPIH